MASVSVPASCVTRKLQKEINFIKKINKKKFFEKKQATYN